MNEYTEKRFVHMRLLTKDEQLALKADLEEDLELYEKILADPRASSEQKSEILNSDIPHARQQLDFLNSILDEPKL